jgi:hypothetical protein
MVDRNITTSQHLLEELEEQMHSLNRLMSDVETVACNLKGTWTALSITHENFQRDNGKG